MSEDIVQTLKNVALGDENAMLDILHGFQHLAYSEEVQQKIHLYLKTNALKSHYVIYLRAILFEHGLGVKPDPEMAFLLMRESASLGNANAIYAVGRYFLYGIGVEKNMINAFQWLKIAAGSPYYVPNAMHDLAVMYEQALGIEKNLALAKEWHEKAIRSGYQGKH